MIAVKLLEDKQSQSILKRCQWLIAIGVYMPLYVELMLLVYTSILLISHFGVALKSTIMKYLIFVFVISFLTSSIIGYNQAKMIQQMFALTLFFLLYEQFFKRNKVFISELFMKYIVVSYYICLLGVLQEIIYFFSHLNILSLLPGYYSTQFVSVGILRVTSTLSEGGWLGTSLLPTIIYSFYYNDPFHLLNKKKKVVIILTSLLTISPFVYTAFLLISLIKIKNRVRYAKRIMGVVMVCLIGYLIGTIIQADNHEKGEGINNIFIRISDTYNVVSNINEDELADVLSHSGNSSSSVIATNMYIGLHAPSRIFGTGIGTNAQSYANIVDVETSFEYNPDDGYSLFNRILSEFGVVGLILYISFVIKHFNRYNMINVCFFFMILSLFLRGGNYMLYGTVFIHFMYYYTSKLNLKFSNGKANLNNHRDI